jgi:hypothetical protein
MVEALLASVHCPCTAEQLARALDWTLQQTTDALGRLQARLVNTGQTLQQTGHHTYTLAPRPAIVDEAQIGRCLRQQRDSFDPVAARVLHRVLTRPGRQRTRGSLDGPDERAAADRLIAAGMVDEKAGMLKPTPRTEATFGTRPAPRVVPIASIQTLLKH